MEDRDSPALIDVGASLTDGTLRYWQAKEALRQGETRLNAQAAIRTALEARATAITGWAAASLLALVATAAATLGWPARAGAAFAALPLFTAASLCVSAARPRNWAIAGYAPEIIVNNVLGTELEILEATCGGISPGIQSNNERLSHMGLALRWAGWMLIAAPIAGLVTYVALRAVI